MFGSLRSLQMDMTGGPGSRASKVVGGEDAVCTPRSGQSSPDTLWPPDLLTNTTGAGTPRQPVQPTKSRISRSTSVTVVPDQRSTLGVTTCGAPKFLSDRDHPCRDFLFQVHYCTTRRELLVALIPTRLVYQSNIKSFRRAPRGLSYLSVSID